jgi:hypothetical protein
MIARTWHGSATPAKAEAYRSHFTTKVVPHLKDIAGHQGAYLLQREVDGRVEFLAVTLWDSIETVKTFSGPYPGRATVEPEGALLCCHSTSTPGITRWHTATFNRRRPKNSFAGT